MHSYDCYCTYHQICVCGEDYKELETEDIFRLKQKLEKILFERMEEQQKKMYEHSKSKETDL